MQYDINSICISKGWFCTVLNHLCKARTFWETHKIWKIFLVVLINQLIYLVNVKTMRKIISNYVCFSKSPNFTYDKVAEDNIFFIINGQLISKANCQAVNSSKNTNEWIHLYYYANVFVFWKKLKSTKRHFEINWPLVWAAHSVFLVHWTGVVATPIW